MSPINSRIETVVTGTELYEGRYYAQIDWTSAIGMGNIVSAFVMTSISNIPTTLQFLGGGQLRVYTLKPSVSVSVKVLYV